MTKAARQQIQTDPSRIVIREERGFDVPAREALLDTCFGTQRNERTCQRLRDGRMAAEGLSFSALRQGRLIGTVRLWHVDAGGVHALVLGPLAVDPSCQGLGVGAELMDHAIDAARALGHGAIILLGDAPYYARFGFSNAPAASLALPGPFERDRLLARELVSGALDDASGIVFATGAKLPMRRTQQVSRQLPKAA